MDETPVKQPRSPVVTSESIIEIVKSLAKAQGEFPMIPKNKEVAVKTRDGGRYTFSYAPLETIMERVRPVLSANGLAVIQLVDDKSVTTWLLHVSGEWIMSTPLPIKVSDDSSSQALGSAITYAKRYSLTAMLGIVADDDDDGNAADGNSATVTKDHTTHGIVQSTTRALTGATVAENLKSEPPFIGALRAASSLGTEHLKRAWNSGTKEDRLSVPPQDWEVMKTVAATADKATETKQ